MRKVLLGSISVGYEVWLPYASGCLQSHALKFADVAASYEFLPPLFKVESSTAFLDRLQSTDVLGLTCYVWNQTQNDRLAQQYKQLNPRGFVLYGGPNVPRDLRLQKKMASVKPYVDLFFVGPGEETFVEFLRGHHSKPKNCIPGTFGLFEDSYFECQTQVRRQIADSDLPDPYGMGVFDEALKIEPRVKCSFETNRGCPFKCAFCDWGGTANSKVTKFDAEKVFQIVDRLYSFENITEIEILDANFGMQKRDLELIEHMIEQKRLRGRSPKISYSGLVKNGSKYLADILRKIHFDLAAEQRNLKISFQTHSKETLKIVQRENIRNERLIPMIEELRAENLSVTSEMIIGLPGETAASWLHTLQRDYDLRIDYMRTYFLQLTVNTDMYSPEFREKYNVKSKILRFPTQFSGKGYREAWAGTGVEFGDCDGTGFEEHEIIYQCSSFDLGEIITMFDYWWFYQNFLNSRALNLCVAELARRGISLSEQILNFYKWLPKTGFLNALVADSRISVAKLFAPEASTDITNLSDYFFYSRCLRKDEVFKMWIQSRQFFREIDQFLEIWIGSADDRQDLIQQQQAVWRPQHSEPLNWPMVRRLFGTDARITNECPV